MSRYYTTVVTEIMCNRLGKFTHVGQNKCPLRSAHAQGRTHAQ